MQYIAIDLKSFYASVECVWRKIDPLDAFLCVADETRTDKTICLAVSPALKSFGIPGRCRLFELKQTVEKINRERLRQIPDRKFKKDCYFLSELSEHPDYKLCPIIAPPRMAKYIDVSAKVYSVYLRYVSKDDIHVYSIDEVFIDATPYLRLYNMTAHELAMRMIKDVLSETGVTATAGIGTNLYLAKIAMDIEAKHIPPDKDGVRIAELDEMSYRKKMWSHTPITDFWRIGNGTAARLSKLGLFTMGDIARASVAGANSYVNEESIYKMFGINAELLIDHAWGVETCRMKDIKSYKPKSNSLSQGQVLPCGYPYEKAKIIVREMAENLSLDLVRKKLVAKNIGLYIGYEAKKFETEFADGTNSFIKWAPPSSHGGFNFQLPTSSTSLITETLIKIFECIAIREFEIRRINIFAGEVISEANAKNLYTIQPSLFDKTLEVCDSDGEKSIQDAVLKTKARYGKNSMMKAFNLLDGAMQIQRNNQIGGHKA